MNFYDVGDAVRLRGSFVVPEVGAADPTAVKLLICKPDSVKQTLVYGVDSEVEKTATGLYYADIIPDQVGLYTYRWEGTGAVIGAWEGEFTVRRSRFYGT